MWISVSIVYISTGLILWYENEYNYFMASLIEKEM